jgi:hypothetical protein
MSDLDDVQIKERNIDKANMQPKRIYLILYCGFRGRKGVENGIIASY